VGATAAAALAVLATQNPTAGNLPRCPFHAVTGLWCPGCGTQRGLHALLHGDLVGAVGYNALMVLALPLVVYAYVAWASHAFGPRVLSKPRLPPVVMRFLPALVIGFAVVRNVPVGHALAP
jgi:hypothetical protein